MHVMVTTQQDEWQQLPLCQFTDQHLAQHIYGDFQGIFHLYYLLVYLHFVCCCHCCATGVLEYGVDYYVATPHTLWNSEYIAPILSSCYLYMATTGG